MVSRTMARQAAMQLLYEHMCGGGEETIDESLELIFEQLSLAQNDTNAEPLIASHSELDYIKEVYKGVTEHQEELDEQIRKHSTGAWSLERMAHIDLCVLRLAVYEIFHYDSIPDNVSINEAVNMAKIYSEPKSGRYINGVLGSIVRDKQEET